MTVQLCTVCICPRETFLGMSKAEYIMTEKYTYTVLKGTTARGAVEALTEV